MARLAPGNFPVGPDATHLRPELTVVRIHVAGGTSLVGKMELRRGTARDHRGAVAIHARDRNVRPVQRETQRLMLCQREFGGTESLHCMAVLATILPRRGRELAAVFVHVAIKAARECDIELGGRARRLVTLRAFHLGMFAQQRIFRCGVLLHSVRRGLETLDGVTGSALHSAGALAKLALVRIGLVAIHALRVRDRLLEIAAGMALRAGHRDMFASQRKLRLGMIE
jgi:hypothetical protein